MIQSIIIVLISLVLALAPNKPVIILSNVVWGFILLIGASVVLAPIAQNTPLKVDQIWSEVVIGKSGCWGIISHFTSSTTVLLQLSVLLLLIVAKELGLLTTINPCLWMAYFVVMQSIGLVWWSHWAHKGD